MVSTTLAAGERLYHRQPGGGGWGDARLRDPAAVARDVRHDKVSVRAARECYGVVIDEATGMVDERQTAQLRASRAACGAGFQPAQGTGAG